MASEIQETSVINSTALSNTFLLTPTITPDSPQSPLVLISCNSDLDNSDYTPHFILDVVRDNILHYDCLHMQTENLTPTVFLQDHKTLPVLMVGALTLALLHAFQMGCLQYFVQKATTVDKQVALVVWGLCDPRIQNWYINDTVHIDKLIFTTFMMEICTNLLTDGWEGHLEQGILNCTQDYQLFGIGFNSCNL